MSSDYQRIEAAIHWLISHREEQPELAELAQFLGLSPSHTQRLFKRWAGISPKQFLQYITVEHAKQLLNESKSVLESALDSGLSGAGRLHDQIINVDAISPGEYKSGCKGLEIQYGIHPTPFGDSLIATTERGICHLSFITGAPETALARLENHWPEAMLLPDHDTTAEVIAAVFNPETKTPLRLMLKGTNFQLKVWEALLTIPSGHALTYQAIAQLIGQPKASRSVGSAIAKNSIAYLIPCHRVIRKSGVIGDYRWGTERKHAILTWEAGQHQI